MLLKKPNANQVALTWLLLFTGNVAHAAIHRSIFFATNDVISPLTNIVKGSTTYSNYMTFTESNVVYTIATKHDMYGDSSGSSNVDLPTISTAQFHSGSASMHIRMNPLTTGHTPGEKVFINVCDGDADSFAISNGQTSAVRFWFYLPSNFQTPSADLMLTEWWLNAADAYVSIPAGTNCWQLYIYNTNGVSSFYGAPASTATWHEFIIQTAPNYVTNGHVTVWFDGAKTLDVQGMPVGIYQNTSRKYFVCVGLYRPGQNTASEAWVDDIRYGDTYLDVADIALTNAPPPFSIQSLRKSGTNLVFKFPSAPGFNYYLESSPSLSPTAWTPIGTNSGGGTITLNIPVDPAQPKSFFRVSSPSP